MTPEASSSHPHIAAALPPQVQSLSRMISSRSRAFPPRTGAGRCLCKVEFYDFACKNLVGQPSQPARICGFHASTNKWRGIEGGSDIKNNHGVSWSTQKTKNEGDLIINVHSCSAVTTQSAIVVVVEGQAPQSAINWNLPEGSTCGLWRIKGWLESGGWPNVADMFH